MRAVRRVCVQWPRLGPYHLARLGAAHRLLAAGGVELVALETAGTDSTYAWREERGPLPYRRVCVFPGRSFNAVRAREMERAVAAALDAEAPDAVAITSYSTPDARAALRWCRRRRRAAVMMFDSRAEDAPRRGWREAIKRTLVRQFDAALVAGAPQAAYAEALGVPRRYVFTPLDVVDNEWFAEAARTARAADLPGAPDGGPFFLTVSRLTPVKNVAALVRAHARYATDAHPPWPLVIVGDGPERPALEALAREGGAPVGFAGFQQVEALPAYYGRAGAFVLPTWKDTWGLVVNEAMAAGLPVVVSRGAGCAADLVEEGENGYTFAPDDERALAEHLGRVASAPPEAHAAMGARSRALITRFRPEDFAEALRAAVHAGGARADRPLTPAASLTLAALRLLARDARAFHAIPD